MEYSVIGAKFLDENNFGNVKTAGLLRGGLILNLLTPNSRMKKQTRKRLKYNDRIIKLKSQNYTHWIQNIFVPPNIEIIFYCDKMSENTT